MSMRVQTSGFQCFWLLLMHTASSDKHSGTVFRTTADPHDSLGYRCKFGALLQAMVLVQKRRAAMLKAVALAWSGCVQKAQKQQRLSTAQLHYNTRRLQSALQDWQVVNFVQSYSRSDLRFTVPPLCCVPLRYVQHYKLVILERVIPRGMVAAVASLTCCK